MEDSIIVDDVLLAKFFAGEATPEEAMAINDWVEASNENRNLYNETEKAWRITDTETVSPDRELAWSNIQSAIAEKKETRIGTFHIDYRMVASLLFFLTAGLAAYYYYYNSGSLKLNETDWIGKQTTSEVETLILADGTSVTINRKSRLRYPKKNNSNTRVVQLTGEAFFDVVHNPEKPFVVILDDVQVKVLGTAFNVSQSDTGTVTEVIRGKVMMETSDEQIILEAGMVGLYNKKTKQLSSAVFKNENNIAYATHSLVFESSALKEVCDQLSKAYGVQFVLNNQVKECTITSEYHDKSLTFILDVISESLGLTYEIKDDTVFISGEGCH